MAEDRAELAAELVDGRLRFRAEAVAEAGFDALESCALLREGEDLWLLPLRDGRHGGLLFKRRNAHGDRVVEAMEFFRRHGLAAAAPRRLRFLWCSRRAAYVARNVFAKECQDD